jgi:hypothetical protein
MYYGVALNPSYLPLPLSQPAQQWFEAPPFVPIYESGRQVVYWVEWSSQRGSAFDRTLDAPNSLTG